MKPFRYIVLAIVFSASILRGQSQEERPLRSTSHQIQAILDSISVTNIRAYLDTLVSFYTRHTMSDTTSDSVGIGAARRWIYRKLQEFVPASGGRLQPMYFDFDTTICGMYGHHRNVMAILPGTLTPNRYFIVSGHMDNRGHPSNACAWQGLFSPGANDDGSGTVISIELARVMSRYSFDASLIFMTVTGEDEGLYGSAAYARYARQSNMRIDGMLTNDVVGNITGENGITDSLSVRHFSSVEDATSHRQLARYFKLKSEFYFPAFTINLISAVDRPGRGGDHMPFQAQGYAAVRFTEPNENLNYQHNAFDIIENMSPLYVARVAKASAAGLASMAWAPETPQGLQVFDPGNGTQLRLQWPSTNTEPDFAGYRVSVRDSGALYYSNIINVGNVNQYTVSGLTPNVAVYVGISAYDTAGNESIFSAEVLGRPSEIPSAPTGVTSTSFPTSIQISWTASPQLDVARYRIYRSTSRYFGFLPHDSVNTSTTQYTELQATPQVLYFYDIRAVDSSGNESQPSRIVLGQLATHDAGILVVDGTRDGPGGAITPTDAEVDLFYSILLAHAASPLSEYDLADSAFINVTITDADMAKFSTVVWHSDVRASRPIYNDTTELKKYLDQGGKLILSGWRLSTSLSSMGGGASTTFPPNSFTPLYLKVDSMRTTGIFSNDFYFAESAMSGYPTLKVDSIKIPNYNGTLVNTDAFSPPLRPGAEVIYTHRGKTPSPHDGRPVALRYLGSPYKVAFIDFPMFYMQMPAVQQAMERALLDLGEVVSVDEEPQAGPLQFALLQNYPNPFNPSTVIGFQVQATSLVSLKIYTVLGQEVATLVNEIKQPGRYRIAWNAGEFPSGVYFYRLQAGKFFETRKLMLLK
jgi:hypothetical protein